MIDANEAALRKYQEKLEKQEASFNYLIDTIDDRLVALKIEFDSLKKLASDYDGYDFEEDIVEIIKDLL